MAFRLLRRPHAALPCAAAGLAATSLMLYPRTTQYADALPSDLLSRKPIYDDLTPKPIPENPASDTTTSSPLPHYPSPTDRLTTRIRYARLFIQAHTTAAETRLNNLLTSFLHLENSFTSTIVSLAPPPESHEKLLPGSIYVLVAAMAGSIISRNRNIVLRATTPLAVGIGAGWVVLPYTMRNVGDLIWRFEERLPVVAENHLRIRSAAEEGWRQTTVNGEKARRWSEEKVRDGRAVIQDWIRKGR